MEVNFTSPGGSRQSTEMLVSAKRMVGSGCEPATVYVLGRSGFGAELLVRDSMGAVQRDAEIRSATWSDEETSGPITLYGGLAETLVFDGDQLEYTLTSGEVRYWENVADEEIREPQVGEVRFLVAGPFDELVAIEVDGVSGHATDVDGDPICLYAQ